MNWTEVFHLARAVTGSGTLSSARYSRKPETRISRQRMTIAAQSVRPGNGLIGGEHQDDRGDEKLVGDRVQHSSKRGLLRPGARQIAVEKIADPGGDKDRERCPSRPWLIRPEQKPGDERDRRDPRVGQNIGQRPVAAELDGRSRKPFAGAADIVPVRPSIAPAGAGAARPPASARGQSWGRCARAVASAPRNFV